MSASSSSPVVDSSSPAPKSNSQLFDEALAQFHLTQSALDQKFLQSQKRLESEFATFDECHKSYSSQLTEYNKLCSMLKDLRGDSDSSSEVSSRLADYQLKLNVCKEYLDRMKQVKPLNSNNSLFIRFLMGKVNVQMWKQADRLNFKDEYNKFKSRTTYLFILFPFIQLFLFTSTVLYQIHQIWLIYYYMTLALRENILQANGSSIKNWWIYHHYISIFIGVIMLLYPHPLIDRHITYFLYFAFVQGLVMFFQNLYQSKRIYVRKSLGKAKAIDVDSTETLVEKPMDLKWLVPMLYGLYLCELFFSSWCMFDYWRNPSVHQLGAIGIGFGMLGIGNAVTTGRVLVSKSNLRKLRKILKLKSAERRGSGDWGDEKSPRSGAADQDKKKEK